MISELLKIANGFIEQVTEKARATSTDNLQIILDEIEKTPDSIINNDLKVMYTIFKLELASRLTQK